MEKKILVPLDYSEVSNEVVMIADEWAKRNNASLHFLRVDKDYMANSDQDRDFFERRFDYHLNAYTITSPYQSILRMGTSYVEIIEAAHAIRADLIIMAAHSHTLLGRLFLGSNTDFVLHHCNCPVYVHKLNTIGFENKIIVPVDYTEVNKTVINRADKWAQQTDSELYFIHTEPFPEYGGGQFAMETGFYQQGDEVAVAESDQQEITQESTRLHNTLKAYLETLALKSPHQSILKFGKPYFKIQELQKKTNAGLIMMAAHSHTMLNRLFLGSNTDYLLHHLNCPMYIYKEAKLS